MPSAQKNLLSVLLGDTINRGLISKATFLKGEDLLYSTAGFPNFFAYPANMTKSNNLNELPPIYLNAVQGTWFRRAPPETLKPAADTGYPLSGRINAEYPEITNWR